MKNIKKIIAGILTALILSLIAYPTYAFGKFKYAENHSNYAQAIKDKKHLTIVYRKGCSRCKKTLPKLFLKHAFDNKRIYIFNAAKLTEKQKDKLDVHVTPVFRLDNHSHNTINKESVEDIWKQAK